MVLVIASIWDWTLSYTLSSKFIRIHSRLVAQSHAFSHRIIGIISCRTTAYTAPIFIKFEKLMHVRTFHHASFCCRICICVWVAISITTGCFILGEVPIRTSLQTQSCSLVCKIRPPTLRNTMEILWASESTNWTLTHTNMRWVLSKSIVRNSRTLRQALFGKVICIKSIGTSLSTYIISIVSKRYQSIDTLKHT